jgi:hypothetical protein
MRSADVRFWGKADIRGSKIYGGGEGDLHPDLLWLRPDSSNAANVVVREGAIRDSHSPVRCTNGQAADGLHPVFEAPAMSVSA